MHVFGRHCGFHCQRQRAGDVGLCTGMAQFSWQASGAMAQGRSFNFQMQDPSAQANLGDPFWCIQIVGRALKSIAPAILGFC